MSRLNKSWQAGEGETALATELHNVLAVSHRQAKGVIDGGCVKVNGVLVHGYGQRLQPGDKLDVVFDPETSYQTLPQPRKQLDKTGFKILWEDKHLLFVDKPAGLLTVPSEKGQEACLAEALTDHYRRRGMKRFQLYIVHRLDRFSSGVLVFAKTPEALHGLKKLFEDHHLNRVYKAILVGELPENNGTLTGKLVEHAKSLKMSVVQPKKGEPKGAKHAITHYRVLERLPGFTVVEVKLETGRRNQIRVQFADRGFPLLGDQVYGEESELIDRQALHAELLGFRHPVTDEAITITAPIPADMEKALKALRNQRRVERADAGVQGEEGIFRPKITAGRKFDRVLRAGRFADKSADRSEDKAGNRGATRPSRGPVRPPRTDGDERPARPRPEGARTSNPRTPSDRPRAPRVESEAPRPERIAEPKPRTHGFEEEARLQSLRPTSAKPRIRPSEEDPRTSRFSERSSGSKPRVRAEEGSKPRTRNEDGSRPRSSAPRPSAPRPANRPDGKPKAARPDAQPRAAAPKPKGGAPKIFRGKPDRNK